VELRVDELTAQPRPPTGTPPAGCRRSGGRWHPRSPRWPLARVASAPPGWPPPGRRRWG